MPRRPAAPLTSPTRRLMRLGTLLGRVGTSVAAERAGSLLRSGPAAEAKRLENLVRNAARTVETLGEMKGAAMKVGQMLSLQEGLLPEPVAEVLRALQQEAPRVPPEVMRYEVEGSLGAPIGELFESFDERAFAAASIGQVHLARLFDGRDVAVKVQYPAIREIVTADLKNLKRLLKSLFSMVFEADFEPLWEELRDRLLEELDYEQEAANMLRMRELHSEVPEIMIPGVIGERTTDRVLTMELVEGIGPDEAAGGGYSQELKNRWGRVLFEFQVRGLFEHRLLHADPNMANFAFLDDGRVIVYDFGSVKRVPSEVTLGYAEMVRALLGERRRDIPEILARIGAARVDGSPIDFEILEPHLELTAEVLRAAPEYRFGEDPELWDKVMEAKMEHLSSSRDLSFPAHVILVGRSLTGHFGNLSRLQAGGPWGEIAGRYASRALASPA